jgi:hypothetical protein
VSAAFALAPAAALARTETATLGGVTAHFSFNGSFPNYSNEQLQIIRDGKALYQQPVGSGLRPGCTTQFPCDPFSIGNGLAVRVVRLQSAGGEPSVVLGLYTGGAHCCVIGQVFSFHAASNSYVRAQYGFGDPGFRLKSLSRNGVDQFVTADDAFAYAFTDFAASGLPFKVLAFRNGRFRRVTRRYPKLIAKDAAVWMKAFDGMRPQHYSDSVGVIAAWAADEDELGHSASVASFLKRQARLGHLNSALLPKLKGTHFIKVLDRFLRRRGYLR